MRGGGCSNHLEYYLPQNEGDESDPIIFQLYLANMTAKTGKYYGDQLFHAISFDNNPTTINFMYCPDYKVEATQVINGLPCILSEEALANPKLLLPYQVSSELLWVYRIKTSTPSTTKISHIVRKKLKVCYYHIRYQVSYYGYTG